MKLSQLGLIILSVTFALQVMAQKSKNFEVASPDGNVVLKVDAADKLQWSAQYKTQTIIPPSSISLQLSIGENLGRNASVAASITTQVIILQCHKLSQQVCNGHTLCG